MTDLIHLLPDAVANQIAAGEVVQRPASVVKELLENTIDAGATDIKLIIRESGKMLIQVIDNGCGMSERDARMCFERHATSKITKADDLLAIRTLGFRGEALASIASVAQVELKTKRHEDEIGTCIQIEGTEFKAQFPVSCSNGTSISVKNLFFNVPARRTFLKSNNLELKYIIDEFFRIALVNPTISFTFYNQDKILFQLPSGHLKERILNLYGNNYGQRLITIEQETPLVNISGYIGKPEYAKKSRGEQFFYTNRRFMKNPYFHHAVETAFRELIPDDSIPSYFIFLEVDPGTIDVNIHPTKTEVNFQDNKSIYAIIHAAVKQSIGKFNLAPSLDFEVEDGFRIPPRKPDQPLIQPTISVNPDYNPFTRKDPPLHVAGTQNPSPASIKAWQDFYKGIASPDQKLHIDIEPVADNLIPGATESDTKITGLEGSDTAWSGRSEKKINIQINLSFLITHTKTGIVIIDQQRAHERILFERFMNRGTKGLTTSSQHLLLPVTLNLNHDDAQLMEEWHELFDGMGFEISGFGKNSYLVQAIPGDLGSNQTGPFIESVLNELKSTEHETRLTKDQQLAKTIALKLAVKRGTLLHPAEIDSIIENLFACKVPDLSPEGKPVMIVMPFAELIQKLKIN